MRAAGLVSTLTGAALVATLVAGCPSSDPAPLDRDSGVCAPYDFGIDETEAEAAVDADESEDGGSEIGTEDVGSDVVGEEAGDASDGDGDTAPGEVADASVDAGAESVFDAGDADAAEVATSPDMSRVVCRSDVESIVFFSCGLSSCHGRYPDGQQGLYIGAQDDWTANVVGAKSVERPDLVRVKPGDPKNSWLAHKIAGDNCLFSSKCKDGDCGDRMPAANQPLSASDLETVLDWIRQGANRDPSCGAAP